MRRVGGLMAVLLMCTVLAGCSAFGQRDLVASTSRAELTTEAANAIAGDLVNRLTEHVGPGTGTIVLNSDGSAFGQALEAALKGRGYAVATNQRADSGAIPVAYVIDNFEGSVLARLSTRELDLGRVYTVSASGAVPSSPWSVLERG